MPEIVEHSQAVLRNFGRIDSSNLFFKVLYYVIDISKYQGDINWQELSTENIDAVIIRLGFRGTLTKVIHEDEKFLEYYDSSGPSYLYRNKYPLSLGFMMNEEILDLEDSAGLNPLEFQNTIVKLSTGIEEPLFNAYGVTLVERDGVDVTKNGFGNYVRQHMADGRRVYYAHLSSFCVSGGSDNLI